MLLFTASRALFCYARSLLFIALIFSSFASNAANVVLIPGTTSPALQTNTGPLANTNIAAQKATKTQKISTAKASAIPYVEDEIIVKFKPNSSASVRNQVIAKHGYLYRDFSRSQKGKLGKDFYENLLVVKLRSKNVDAALTSLRSDPTVEYADRNYIVRAQAIPNDPMFASQWAANNTGQTNGSVNADMNLPETWDYKHDCNLQVIAVLDTGIDYTHPDLLANIWSNPNETPNNGVDDDQDGYIDDVSGWNWVAHTKDPFDDNFHGTHVAGIAAAAGNNGIGIAGVCWVAKIMPLKILDNTGSGYTSDAILAIQYATQNDATIINMSWGGGGYVQSLQEAITAANAAGTSVVAAAGNNSSSSPFYPAAYSGVIAVAATGDQDTLSPYSNYGPWVSIAAPGDGILSTVPGGGYDSYNGTSMAAPQVSGVLALLRSSGLSKAAAETALLNGGDSIDALNPTRQEMMGGGRVNAYDSLRFASDTVPPTPPSNLYVTAINAIRATITGSEGADDLKVGGYRVMLSTDNITFVEVKQRYKSLPITIDNLKPLTTYYVNIHTADVAGNLSQSASVTVTTPDNLPPVATKPTVSATFYYPNVGGGFGTILSDPEGGLVKAIFDYGNGIVYDTNWFLPSGSSVGLLPRQAQIQPGTYAVRAMAVDELGLASPWSASTTYTVVPNTPPDIPDITGPTTLITGQQGTFHFSITDSTPTFYGFTVDWGDGQISDTGPYIYSYENVPYVYFSHFWSQAGTYAVRVKASEGGGSGGASTDWSAPLSVTIANGTAPPTADVGVVKIELSTVNPMVGQMVEYTNWYYNYGPQMANGFKLTYEFSQPVVLRAYNGTCSSTTSTVVVCDFGALNVGNGHAISAYLAVDPTAAGSMTIKTTASANEVDPYSANNSQSLGVSISSPPTADLSLGLSAPASAFLGQTVNYMISVTNNGPSPATSVTVTGTLPTCTLGSIASGATANCPTTSMTATTVGTLTQTMTVTGTETDPTPGNNSKSVSTTVTAAMDLTPTALSASRSGIKVSVSDTAKNKGRRKITTAFTVGYYLSTDKVYQAGTDIALARFSDGSGVCTRSITSLSAGSSSSGSKTCYKPNMAKKGVNYYVLVVDDAGKVIAESNETNNTKATGSTIRWL